MEQNTDMYADLEYISQDRQSPEKPARRHPEMSYELSTISQQREPEVTDDNLACTEQEKVPIYLQWRFIGGMYLFALLLGGVVFSLLAAYLQVHAEMLVTHEELEQMLLKQSLLLKQREKEKANVNSLRDTQLALQKEYHFLQEELFPELRHNQSLLLQKRDRIQGKIQDISIKHRSLQEEYDLLKSHIPISKQSDMVQNCQKTSPESERQVCYFCPPGWKVYGASCYFLHLDSQNWEISLKRCQMQGGHLAVITSLEEQNFLKSMVKNVSWIGLSDRKKEGDWRWADGTPYNSAPKFWQPNQPDNRGNEDCVTLSPGWLWNDDKCRKPYNSVCERNANKVFLQGGILSN
ncbi:hypothetical protein XENTR_v10017709 [Xenopus tropicalis]|nr:hypothetical protein XENTR_v10017709 [Xenopus tropicalis]